MPILLPNCMTGASVQLHRLFSALTLITSLCLLYMMPSSTYRRDNGALVHEPRQRHLIALRGSNEVQLSVTRLYNTSLLSRQNTRQDQLRRMCSTNQTAGLYPTTLSSLIVDDTHHVIYCYIPKVACTNWKRVLVNLTGRIDTGKLHSSPVHRDWLIQSVGLQFLRDYSPADISRRLRSYRKFLFVRHPLERLLSAYRDKFIKRNKFTVRFHHKYGRPIIQRFRKNPSNWSMRAGSDVTFPEFIKYLGYLGHTSGVFNPHWEPYYKRCDPCRIRYDYIGKLETMESDTREVLHGLFRLPYPFGFPRAKHGRTSGAIARKYYKLITKQDLESVIKVYARDFDLFGYVKTVPT